jgi:hypothetical protein
VSKFILRRWVLSALAGLALTATAAAQNPPPIFTKNAALRLPIQLDDRARAEVAEVQLYVRRPNGDWECVQTAPPSQTVFDFRASEDGEYRFTFVTVDRRGTKTPANPVLVPPHRTVIIDATPPDVSAEPRTMKGETFLQCQVRDANPDWSTLRVVYLTPDNTWQPLTPAGSDSPTLFRVPNSNVFNGKIRVTVADRAGNRTTREIDMGDPIAPLGMPGKVAIEKGKPDPTLFPKDDRFDSIQPPPIPDKGVRGANYSELPKAPKTELPDLPPLPDVATGKLPDAIPDIKLPPDISGIKIPEPPGVKSPTVKAPVDQYKMPDPPTPPDVSGIRPPIELPPPPPIPGKTTAAMKPSEVPIPELPKPDKSPAAKPMPTGSHPILNSRTCTINYQLDGPAKYTTKIDFWATADGGRTWMPIKDAAGGVPPAKLTLPADGVFGIRIRPGGGSKPPEPMEEPDCVVEVDSIKPSVSLTTPTVATDDGMMIIGWTAEDKNLLSNAINLYYAAKADGPWEVIVSGYKNEGVYRWALPTGLTGPVHLRVEATDRAGNVGRYDLPTPVALEASKQRVKVIGVGAEK